MAANWNAFAAAIGNQIKVAPEMPYVLKFNIPEQLVAAGAIMDDNGVIVIAFCELVNLTPNTPFIKDNAMLAVATMTTTVAGVGNTAVTALNAHTIDDIDERRFMKRFYTIRPVAAQWMYDLVACQQVKSLSLESIKSYFQSINLTSVKAKDIQKIITPISFILPKATADAALIARITANDFTKYHTTATSTPGLAQLMIDGSGVIGGAMISDPERNAVAVALATPHDKALADQISTKVVVLTHAYLKANKMLPDGWYQGDKAVSRFPPSTYSAAYKLFGRARDITAGATAIADAETEAELVAAIPNVLRK